MAYYTTCPHCGANLDPGERCDCQDKKGAEPPQEEQKKSIHFTALESHKWTL